MEFEKLQEIIAEVMNVETDDITLDTSFVSIVPTSLPSIL